LIPLDPAKTFLFLFLSI